MRSLLCAKGHDGFFVTLADRQGGEFVLHCTTTSGSGLGKLAEQSSHPGITLAGFGALSFFGTNADPASQALGVAELTHVGTDLDQEHGDAHLIDPRDGLQQDQQRLLRRQALGIW